jgi:hypothetical protein
MRQPALPVLAAASVLAAMSGAASAQTRPAAVSDLMQCRTVTDTAERARCFDERAAALDQALQDGSLVVVDAAALAEAEQRSFGLPTFSPSSMLPSLSGLGSSGSAETAAELAEASGPGVEVSRRSDGEVQSLSGLPVARTYHAPDGKMVAVLENGQVWRQTDTRRVPLPRQGEAVTAEIQRAAMGSFMLRLSHHHYAMRARRDS